LNVTGTPRQANLLRQHLALLAGFAAIIVAFVGRLDPSADAGRKRGDGTQGEGPFSLAQTVTAHAEISQWFSGQ